MILQAAGGIDEVQAAGHGQAGIVVVTEPPGHVVAVQAILLDAQHGRLIIVVAEADGVEQNLIELVAVAVLRIHREVAAQQADAIAVIVHAAVHAALPPTG